MSDYDGCMACSPNPHIAVLRSRAEQAEVQRDEARLAAEGAEAALFDMKARVEKAERERDEARAQAHSEESLGLWRLHELGALRARAEQAERDRDDAQHNTAKAIGDLESLQKRVLALAEEWERAGLLGPTVARALREAVEGKP